MSTMLDRTNRSYLARWWWTVDRGLFIAILLLVFLGGVMVAASSPPVATRIGLNEFYFVYRQMVFLPLALVIAIGVSFMDPVLIRRFAVLGLLACLVMLALLPFMGDEIKGAKRWLHVGGMSIQPSEFIKPFFAVVSAWFFARRVIDGQFPGYTAAILLYGLVVALLAIQPDLGMIVTITAVWLAEFFVAGLPMYLVIALLLLAALGIYGAYHVFDHVQKRIDTFFDPSTGDTYQVDRSLEAFQRGGLVGVGPGEGSIKRVLPDSHTDFVFSVLGEEFGVIACLVVLGIYAFILFRGFYRIWHEKDLFVGIAVIGLLTQFGAQALINMGVALHLLPTKGMTLPFLSYGGSSSLALGIGMGMLLALTRRRYGTEHYGA